MAKEYKVVLEDNVNSFEKEINNLGALGYAVVSHSHLKDFDEGDYVFSAVMVKYTDVNMKDDHIDLILDGLDSIKYNTDKNPS